MYVYISTFTEDTNKIYGFRLYLWNPVQYVYSLKNEALVFSKKFVITNEIA